jgi:autotransporter-associated beta strand protein
MRRKNSWIKHLSTCLLIITFLISPTYQSVLAASGAWRGPNSNLWNDNANWTGASFPNAVGETATFDNQAGVPTDVEIANGVTVGTLTFDTANNFTLSGAGPLTFDVSFGSAALNVFTATASSTPTLSVPVVLADNWVITQNATSPLTVAGNITETILARSIAKAGPGPLVLSGNNTFSGGLTVNTNGGMVSLAGPQSAGTGTMRLQGAGTFQVCCGAAVFPNQLSLSGGNNALVGNLAFTNPSSLLVGNTSLIVTGTVNLAKLNDAAGTRNFRKLGPGTLNLNVSTAGTNPGDFLRNEASSTGPLNLYGSGTLARTAFLAGSGGGTVNVGDSLNVSTGAVTRGTGTLTLKGHLDFASNTITNTNTALVMDLNGPMAGTEYDQVRVIAGNVGSSYANLNNAQLQLSLGFTPTVGTAFTLVNMVTGTISGQFKNLPEGSVLQLNGLPFLLNYTPSAVTLTRLGLDETSITATGGTPQTAEANAAFATPLQATVFSGGQPQAGVLVKFYAPSSGASVTFPSGNTALTDSNGQASVTVAANAVAGTYVVTATTTPDGVAPATFTLTNTVINTPPTISSLPNQNISINGATGEINFTVGDGQTLASSLTLTATTNNAVLAPLSGLVFGGSSANRTLTVTPAAGQTGTSLITVIVSDGALTASSTFTLTVSYYVLYFPLVSR